jgi:predicted  nucleic acid-binding Zn-ribbon protein
MRGKTVVLISLAAVVLAAAGGLGYTAYRWQLKKKNQATYEAFMEKSFRDLATERLKLEREREYLAICLRQAAGRRTELTREIAQLKEVVGYLKP